MELDTGLTIISAICTVFTIVSTLKAKKYFTTVKTYFLIVKKQEIHSCLRVAVGEMQKFGSGCTESSIKGLSPKSHSSTCKKVQDLVSALRRNKNSLKIKYLKVDEVIEELDDLLMQFSKTTVIDTKSLMSNGKPLYDKLNELENHFDPSTSIPSP